MHTPTKLERVALVALAVVMVTIGAIAASAQTGMGQAYALFSVMLPATFILMLAIVRTSSRRLPWVLTATALVAVGLGGAWMMAWADPRLPSTSPAPGVAMACGILAIISTGVPLFYHIVRE